MRISTLDTVEDESLVDLFDKTKQFDARQQLYRTIYGLTTFKPDEVTSLIRQLESEEPNMELNYLPSIYFSVKHFLLVEDTLRIPSLWTWLFDFKGIYVDLTVQINELHFFLKHTLIPALTKYESLDHPPAKRREINQHIQMGSELCSLSNIQSQTFIGKYRRINQTISFISINRETLCVGIFQLFCEFESFISLMQTKKEYHLNFARKGPNLEIFGLFHPCITKPIRSDFIPPTSLSVITGPNMSGKSTLVEAICIVVFLAQSGVPVPAREASVPHFDFVFWDRNISDIIDTGLSHFTAQVEMMVRALNEAATNKRGFIAFDELFQTTNPDEGYELLNEVLSVLNGLENTYSVVSTHYDISSESLKDSMHHLVLELGDEPKSTYQLSQGASNKKLAYYYCDKMGLTDLLEFLKQSDKV